MADIQGSNLQVPPIYQQMIQNPAAQAQSWQSLQQQMLQNRLLSQEVGGKIARGKAAQGAIDPVTGQFDPDAYMRNLRADPSGAQFAPEAAVQAQQQRQAQIMAATAELERQQKELGLDQATGKVVANGMLPAIRDGMQPDKNGQPKGLTREQAMSALADSVVLGGGTAKLASRAAALAQTFGDDPLENLKKIQGAYILADPTPDRVGAVWGATDTKDVGDRILSLQTPAITGRPEVRTVIGKGLTPSEAETPAYTYVDDAGVSHIVTKREAADAAAKGQTPGGIKSGLPVGRAEEVAQGVQQAQGWAKSAEVAPDTKAQIKNLRDQVGRFTSGPKASWLYRTQALAGMLGIAPPQMKDEVAAQEEFNKLAQQFINTNAGQLGEGTDRKLTASMHASPNELMSKQGLLGVLALMEGQQDAIIAKNAAWQAWHGANPGGTAQQFMTQWNKLYNPRVFQSLYMSPQQREVMLRGMAKDERDQFQKDWVFAKKAKWIN